MEEAEGLIRQDGSERPLTKCDKAHEGKKAMAGGPSCGMREGAPCGAYVRPTASAGVVGDREQELEGGGEN